MEAGQLEKTEFKTIIIICPKQIKGKWLIVPILPPLTRPITEKWKISQESLSHLSQQVINYPVSSLSFSWGIHGEECKEQNTNESS